MAAKSSTPRRNNKNIRTGRYSFSDVLLAQNEKQKFETYWDAQAVEAGFASGQLLLGQVRINPRNFMEAYTKHPRGDADIFIPGTKSRNRALNGDIVVIRLEQLRNWKVYDSFIPKKDAEHFDSDQKQSGSNNNASNHRDSYVTVGEFLRKYPQSFTELFKNIPHGLMGDLDGFTDPVNLPGEPSVALPSASRLPWWQIIQRVGRVVSIHRKLHCRACVGLLRPIVPSQKQKDVPNDAVPATNQDWNSAILSPTDSRMPRIVIPKTACPPDFVRQPETFKSVRFVARIVEWTEENIFAKGELLRSFAGNVMSCVDSETDRILVSAGLPNGLAMINEFPKAVDNCVEKLTQAIQADMAAELTRRRDLRDECIFTIDPRTARDLDDALHVRQLSGEEIASLAANGITDAFYEVGVHIADVTYYVRPGDPIDQEAEMRATTIYLVQLCVPMLPRALCEDLCSLHPGSDKLTFSVIFTLSEDGRMLTKWFGRTAINSRAKLSYEDAQSFIDEPERDWTVADFPNMFPDTDVRQICQGVLLLNKLAVDMRSRRFTGGALQLNQVKPVFALSETSGLPIGVSPYIAKPANHLVEEWMLAANEAVAVLLAKKLPATAFLRRHPPPTAKQIKEAQALLVHVGIQVDIKSAGDIQKSLFRLSGNPIWQHSDRLAELCLSMMGANMEDTRGDTNNNTNDEDDDNDRSCSKEAGEEEASAVAGAATTADDGRQAGEREGEMSLEEEAHMLATLNVLTKCMNLAEYFCLGTVDTHTDHYALNIANYTHFTSPIRRFADVIVHRQLAAVLAEFSVQSNRQDTAEMYRSTSTSPMLGDVRELAAIADYCNARKQDAQKASEESSEVFFTVLVKECGPLIEAASIVGILTHSFDVLILSTGSVKRVYLNKLDLRSFEYDDPPIEIKNISGTGTLYIEWHFRPNSIDGQAPANKSGPLSSDPAIHSVKTSTAPPTPPCGCFRQHIKMFDLCQCQLAVEELPKEANDNSPAGLPKVVATIIRPTCALCEAYV